MNAYEYDDGGSTRGTKHTIANTMRKSFADHIYHHNSQFMYNLFLFLFFLFFAFLAAHKTQMTKETKAKKSAIDVHLDLQAKETVKNSESKKQKQKKRSAFRAASIL